MSSNTLLSELLGYTFQKETRISCVTTDDYSGVAQILAGQNGENALLLHDAAREDLNDLLENTQGCLDEGHGSIVSALFNLEHDVAIERMALKYGVKGFFYRSERLGNLLKGTRMLLAGETWIPRDILFDLALNDAPIKRSRNLVSSGMTPREIEILLQLSTGLTNEEIAAKFCISIHTVKAHLYSLYRKIGAVNRFQAALWAANHL